MWTSGNDPELDSRAPGFNSMRFRRRAVSLLSSQDHSRVSFGHTRYTKIHVVPQETSSHPLFGTQRTLSDVTANLDPGSIPGVDGKSV